MKVVLGVTGCIGAYKSALILRLLQKEGFDVLPVMTKSAQQFLGPLTLEKLSGHPVVTGLFDDHEVSIEHISLARASDLLLVAPATANILGKFANGIADDFLSTLYLSTTTPVIVAPAMNVEMWRHPATQANIKTLEGRGVVIVEPESGYLACGEEGEGRLAEPEVIVDEVVSLLRRGESLKGKRVLVTAGPTVEDIDPVRFISNRSSGKMGYAIAREAVARGAEVVLVSGPCALRPPHGAQFVDVRSASQMAAEVFARFPDADIVVMAAAVGDYRPMAVSEQKLKKSENRLTLELQPTVDILKCLGERKTRQFLVGFAAESENVVEYAQQKLQQKKLDLIVANAIAGPSSTFGSENNQVVLIDPEGGAEKLELLPKSRVANLIWTRIEARMNRVETR